MNIIDIFKQVLLELVEILCYISTNRIVYMKKSAQNQIYNVIKSHGKNWVFSAKDFSLDNERWEIDHSFHFLQKEGKIKKIIPGLFYYPEYSEIMQEIVAPDLQKVAYALARKYNWTIFPEGSTALNFLGFSTQVPAKYIFISNGKSRKYKIFGMPLEFRHRIHTESAITNENSNLVVQSIKSLGKVNADDDFIKQLSKKFTAAEWINIEKSAAKVADWILVIIKKAKELANNG